MKKYGKLMLVTIVFLFLFLFSMKHFEHALILVPPSPMRGATVDVPRSSWDEIGGHNDIKKKLKQAIGMNLFYSSHVRYFL